MVTEEQWKRFDIALRTCSPQFLSIDGSKVIFAPGVTPGGKYFVVVSNEFGQAFPCRNEGDWGRKVARKVEAYQYRMEFIKRVKRHPKAWPKEERERILKKRVAYTPLWHSTATLIRHLKKNCESIEFAAS